MGPSVLGLEDVMKPFPARLQLSPFWSTNAPDAPADVGSALMMIWLISSSPSSYFEPAAQVPGVLWPSCQLVESSGVVSRKWIPAASMVPLPIVRTILPL